MYFYENSCERLLSKCQTENILFHRAAGNIHLTDCEGHNFRCQFKSESSLGKEEIVRGRAAVQRLRIE